VFAGVCLGLIGCALVVFFCAYLSSVLEGDLLSRVAFAGGVILAVGLAIDITISVSGLLWTRGRGLSRLETDVQPLGGAA
jgi:hypothetical protein